MSNNSSNKGIFIAVEGMDGCGKSTITKHVCELLKKAGHDVVQTYEMGGTPIGKELRKICFSKREDESLDPIARLMMVFSARIQHLKEVINPAIQAGKIVVSDRYAMSTMVYQGHNDGLSNQIENLHNVVGVRKHPDIYIWLKIDPEVAYARGNARNGVDNDVYKTDLSIATRTALAYQNEFTYNRVPRIELDANQDLECVIKQLEESNFLDLVNQKLYIGNHYS
jgi:dTMP kinase